MTYNYVAMDAADMGLCWDASRGGWCYNDGVSAIRYTGKEKKGTVVAENEAQAANKLKKKGLFPTSIHGRG